MDWHITWFYATLLLLAGVTSKAGVRLKINIKMLADSDDIDKV